MAFVQRSLSKTKPRAKIIGVEENENAEADIFKLLQHKRCADMMKFIVAKSKFQKAARFSYFSDFIDKKSPLRAKN